MSMRRFINLVEKPDLSESVTAIADYGYWIKPDGEVIPIDERHGHQKVAFEHIATEQERAELGGGRLEAFIRRDETYRFTARAMQQGWVRVIEQIGQQSMFIEFRVKLQPIVERALIGLVQRSARNVFDYTVVAHGNWENFDAARDVINFVRSKAPVTEEVNPGGRHFLHVTSAKNLKSIMRIGLQPNAGGGNYSGYHTSLEGVYVTREPRLIYQHLVVRDIKHAYLLAVVRVGTTAFVDEDVLDDLLARSLDGVVKAAGYKDVDEMIDDMEDEDFEHSVAQTMFPGFKQSLGPARPGTNIDSLLLEFCETWLRDHMGGDSGAGNDWWVETKDTIIRAFPKLAHPNPEFGNEWSLRIPHAVGFEGETRIVALVEVNGESARTVYGEVPAEARQLIDNVVRR